MLRESLDSNYNLIRYSYVVSKFKLTKAGGETNFCNTIFFAMLLQ